MHVALLANPIARAGISAAERAAERLRAHGIRTTLISGGSARESSELLAAALELGVDAVLVAGGDGTVHLAVQQLAHTGIPLGIVPAGTGNDLATTVGLRDMDAGGAADAVIAGRTRTIDLARIERPDGTSTLYATVLASGFDSKVNDRANRMRWPQGALRYRIALLIEFLRLRAEPYRLELESEDGDTQHVTGDLLIAAVGNGGTYGGGVPICPGADPSDGVLDVTIVRPAGRLHLLLRLLPRVYRGTHESAPEVSTYRVRAVRVDAPEVTAYADGDPMGALPVRVEVVPHALTLYAPA